MDKEQETQEQPEDKPLESASQFSEQALIDLMLSFSGAVWNTRAGDAKFLWLENVIVLPKDLYKNCKGFKTRVKFPTMSKILEFEVIMQDNRVIYGSVSAITEEEIKVHIQTIPMNVFVAIRARDRAQAAE